MTLLQQEWSWSYYYCDINILLDHLTRPELNSYRGLSKRRHLLDLPGRREPVEPSAVPQTKPQKPCRRMICSLYWTVIGCTMKRSKADYWIVKHIFTLANAQRNSSPQNPKYIFILLHVLLFNDGGCFGARWHSACVAQIAKCKRCLLPEINHPIMTVEKAELSKISI